MERNVMGELNVYRGSGAKPNFSEIARRHGMDRHTVAKYWREGESAADGRSARGSAFDPLEEVIRAKAQLPGMTKMAVYAFLREGRGEGLPGYGAFTAWCRARDVPFGGAGGREPHPRFETPPGRQLQFDWKEGMRLVDSEGEVFEFSVFTATLGYSRKHRFIPVRSRTLDDLLSCLLATFTRLGGVPEECITDNMSCLVTVSGRRRTRQERAWRFAREAGFELRLCAPRSPQTKGKDESANRFLNRLLAYGGEFTGWSGLVEAVARVEAQANSEPNRTTGLPPDALFMREKESLRPIGNLRLLESMVGDVSVQTVPPTMLVRAAGREWSVPRRCIGRRVSVVAMPGGQVVVRMAGEEVAVHDAASGPSRPINYDPDHYGQALEGKRGLAGLATLMWTVPGGAQETGGPYMRDPRHPRHFTDEFKRQIVDLYNAGKPKREIMDEYDLGKSTVERWIKSINATGSPRAADNRTPEQNRILELERENRRLRMEVDVLKQAALIYARK